MPDSTPKSQPEPLNRDLAAGKHPALLERRYLQEVNQPDYVSFVPLLGAGLCLGAASYGHYVMTPEAEYRSFLVFCGLVGLGLTLFRVTRNRSQVLVGDAGGRPSSRTASLRDYSGGRSSQFVIKPKLWFWSARTRRYTFRAACTRERSAPCSPRRPNASPNLLDVPAKLVDELPKLNDAPRPQAEPVHSLQIAGQTLRRQSTGHHGRTRCTALPQLRERLPSRTIA